jgi:hypothetical protein
LPLPLPQNVQATPVNHDVTITWTAPSYDPNMMTLQGYNVTRDGTKINTTPVTGLAYTDMNVISGQHVYCISAIYNIGESQGSCKTVDVAVGIAHTGDQPALMIYPNPAHGSVTVKSAGINREFTIYDQMGKAMHVNVKSMSAELSTIDISALPAGIYLLSYSSTSGTARTKLVVY